MGFLSDELYWVLYSSVFSDLISGQWILVWLGSSALSSVGSLSLYNLNTMAHFSVFCSQLQSGQSWWNLLFWWVLKENKTFYWWLYFKIVSLTQACVAALAAAEADADAYYGGFGYPYAYGYVPFGSSSGLDPITQGLDPVTQGYVPYYGYGHYAWGK